MKLTVKKNLHITEDDLDPNSLGGRVVPTLIGATYIKGDVIEITDIEAGALLALYPDHFSKPKDDHHGNRHSDV